MALQEVESAVVAAPASGGFVERLKRQLARPGVVWVAAVVGLVLTLPGLGAGMAMDDYIHGVVARGGDDLAALHGGPLDLFTFAPADDAVRAQLVEEGIFPWLTGDDFSLAFWRPISAATHWLDHALWPESPALMHLHSMLWFALLILVVGLLYRRLHGPGWVAGLALMLFAFEDAHGPMVGWLSGRYGIVTALFAISALWAYDRARRDGWRPGAVVGPAAFAAGLASGEAGISVTGYLLAHALFIDKAGLRRRALALAPYAAIALVWLVSIRSHGYGVVNSTLYADPAADPLGFVNQVATHLPVMLTAQFSGFWSDLYRLFGPDVELIILIASGVYVLLLLDAFWPMFARRALARFWGLGLVLAAIPACTGIIGDRLLVLVGVGGLGLVACFFEAPEGQPDTQSTGRMRQVTVKAFTVGFVAAHLVLAPLLLPLRTLAMVQVNDVLERAHRSIPSDPAVSAQTVVLVNSVSYGVASYLTYLRELRGTPRPERWRTLNAGVQPVSVTRVDERSLRVRPARGFFSEFGNQATRDVSYQPFAVGDVIRLSDMSAQITEITDEGSPTEVVFEFATPLEDPSRTWLYWTDIELAPFKLPAVGETVTLPAIDQTRAFFGTRAAGSDAGKGEKPPRRSAP